MSLQRITIAAGIALVAASFFGCKEKNNEAIPRIKKVVRVNAIATKYIELDDGSRYGLGENLYNHLISRLQENNHFVVVVNEPSKNAALQSAISSEAATQESDRLKFDFAPYVVANFSAQVKELTFSHGTKGAHRFAGFTREFQTPWNDGSMDAANEFPARSTDLATGWFGNTLDPQKDDDYDSIAGVDSGEQGEFNIVVASLHYRRDKFTASTSLDTKLDLLVDKETRRSRIDATGKGFLFAIGASWQRLMVEFGVTRRTALKNTFDTGVEKIAEQIQTDMLKVKFRTRIEQSGEEGIVLNAGRREGILVGDQFVVYREEAPVSRLKVTEVFQIGSLASVIDGDTNLKIGDIVTMENEAVKPAAFEASRALAAGSPVEKKSISIDPPEFSDPDGGEYANLKDSVSLPYFLLRWGQYDQEIKQDFQSNGENKVVEKAQSQWNLAQIGVSAAWALSRGRGVKVAVIDSGVDYNHKNLGQAFDRNHVGFDFISFDPRPFDDNSHGTAVAGIIAGKGIGDEPVGVAPDASLLAYKVFDPWGGTTSAALYGAMDRAIQDGADILVAAWDTRKSSQTMEKIVHLVEAKNVLLVVAAGDRGTNLRDTPSFPAAFNSSPNVLVVGATNSTGGLSRAPGMASNFGDGIVDIAAPGENLKVLSPRSEYLMRSGSDLAAGHVAGVAAILKSSHRELTGKNLKEQILAGCAHNNALDGLVTQGCVLNAARALGIRD